MANAANIMSVDDFEAEFNFIWKIKNFSRCLPGKCVKSPVFTVESINKSRWCLQLWPKQYTHSAYIECYLVREADRSGLRRIRVAFEISFLDSYDIQLLKKMQEASFLKGESKGFAELIKQSTVFNYRINEYLPENILTVCCRVKQIGKQQHLEPVFCSASSLIGVEQSSFYWNIIDFSKIRPGMLRSIRKRNPHIKVELSLTAKPEEALQFEISHSHLHKPNMTDCKISVITSLDNAAYSKRESKYLEGKVWEFPIFVKKSQLIAEKGLLLTNDTLVLKCDISVSIGVISSKINGYRSSSFDDEASISSENEDSLSTSSGIISKLKEEVHSLKKALKSVESREEKKTNAMIGELPHKDSSLMVNGNLYPLLNEHLYSLADNKVSDTENLKRSPKPSFEDSVEDEASSSTENNDCPSNANEEIPETRKEVKKIPKEADNIEEINKEKILQEFSCDFSPSSINEDNHSDHKNESYSTVDEAADKTFSKSFNIEKEFRGTVKDVMKTFYQDGTFSDISLTVGNQTFLGHKLILSLKSCKFKEIFMHNLSKRISLSDLDPETLRDLLDFVYTNNVENMTWEKAEKLFFAAQNYQMPSLKHACLKFMKENIDVSNSCNVLIFANEQQEENLKQLTLEFIVSHGKTVINTKAWDKFSKKHVKLAFQTLQKMYLKKIET